MKYIFFPSKKRGQGVCSCVGSENLQPCKNAGWVKRLHLAKIVGSDPISLLLALIISLCITSALHAAPFVNDGGITIDGNKAKYFTGYTVTSNAYVYNEAAGTSSTAGWVAVRAVKEPVLQYKIEDVTGTLTVRIEGTIIGASTVGEIYTLTIGTATDGFIPIGEGVDEIRNGIKVTPGGSGKVTLWGKFTGL